MESAWLLAAAEVAADPTAPVPGLTRYVLRAETVEFWQGDPGRRHIRLAYERSSGGWERGCSGRDRLGSPPVTGRQQTVGGLGRRPGRVR
ncbi:pyridoxine 5'-phosphate oxidase C-terminal domain-containing protein [Kitasatospora gansuensis]